MRRIKMTQAIRNGRQMIAQQLLRVSRWQTFDSQRAVSVQTIVKLGGTGDSNASYPYNKSMSYS